MILLLARLALLERMRQSRWFWFCCCSMLFSVVFSLCFSSPAVGWFGGLKNMCQFPSPRFDLWLHNNANTLVFVRYRDISCGCIAYLCSGGWLSHRFDRMAMAYREVENDDGAIQIFDYMVRQVNVTWRSWRSHGAIWVIKMGISRDFLYRWNAVSLKRNLCASCQVPISLWAQKMGCLNTIGSDSTSCLNHEIVLTDLSLDDVGNVGTWKDPGLLHRLCTTLRFPIARLLRCYGFSMVFAFCTWLWVPQLSVDGLQPYTLTFGVGCVPRVNRVDS